MAYPDFTRIDWLMERIKLLGELQHERGAARTEHIVTDVEQSLKQALSTMMSLEIDPALAANEPDDLESIRRLRPAGPRVLSETLDQQTYRDRLEGALMGRFAGCTLGAIVENWEVDKMESWAKEIGDAFPPTDYWSAALEPHLVRYGMSRCDAYTRGKMSGVPVDDDITYTIIGLLIAEQFGLNFTTEDVGKAWVQYLPCACTAEAIALENLRNGIPADLAGSTDNPYCDWIGADIRADPWGYLAPGRPELAAEMAYRDAYLSHRRNGTYGEMFFAAAIAAAFTVDDPVEALKIGLTEIPESCALADAVRWALDIAPSISDYRAARAAVDERFKGMNRVHTINNACLTIWGLTIGGTDLTRVLSETIAMGLDNDCTGATAGSIAGAVIGRKKVPSHWADPFGDTVYTYLNGHPCFSISDVVSRFMKLAAN